MWMQTRNFDIARQSPRGHGEVICFSVYGGAELDFRESQKGRRKGRQNQLWVDTMVEDEVCPCLDPACRHDGCAMWLSAGMQECTSMAAHSVQYRYQHASQRPAVLTESWMTHVYISAAGIHMPGRSTIMVFICTAAYAAVTCKQHWLDVCSCKSVARMQAENAAIFAAFEPFFTDPDIKKVWHNYSFDRHVFTNCGIRCKGFHGDTMHMARLWNSSRKGKSNYSLESLSGCV